MYHPLHRHVTPRDIDIRLRGSIEGKKYDKENILGTRLVVNRYEVQLMSRIWRYVVDASRVLLERSNTLDTASICTSFVKIWRERRDLDIRIGVRGVDDEG